MLILFPATSYPLKRRRFHFSIRDLGKRSGKFCVQWTFQPEFGGPDGILFLYLLYFPCHKHPIYLQWYSYMSCQTYVWRESYNFLFPSCVCFISRILRLNSSPGSLAVSHFGSRPEIWAEGEICAGNRPAWSNGMGSCEEALRQR